MSIKRHNLDFDLDYLENQQQSENETENEIETLSELDVVFNNYYKIEQQNIEFKEQKKTILFCKCLYLLMFLYPNQFKKPEDIMLLIFTLLHLFNYKELLLKIL